MDHRDKNVIVLGRGKTGRAVEQYLTHRGAKVETADDHDEKTTLETVLSHTYDYAVVSPGIPLDHCSVIRLKECGVPVLSELDLAFLECASKSVAAISGTNGKTTTCTILGDLLSTVGKCHLVGNVGVPWIGEVPRIGKSDFVVVETSSFQIEQSQLFRPRIAALTNVGEDHLDRHLTVEVYQRLKLSLLDRAEIKVVNIGDPPQRDIKGAITYSDSDPSADYFLSGGVIYHRGKKYNLPTSSRGAAYDLDYLCAFTVAATFCGIKKSFLSLYDKVKLPSFRMEYVGDLCGAKIFNDSKGTNIDATLFAVRQCKEPLALILGGSDKGEDFSRLFRSLGDHVKRIYLTGGNVCAIYEAAEGRFREKCRLVESLQAAVLDFISDPLPILLFSPASASFDRYRNYEERGRCFNEIIKEYGGKRDDARL